ncbi:hypothetical protein [Haliangium sp.]|uniref:hypothetical protein n=1 Tax=Haliangium sp. TaxID=2663208 RepID=UPI003D110C9B
MAQIGRTPEEQVEQQVETAPEPEVEAKPTYALEVLANHEATWTEFESWKDVPVGHAWIRLVAPTGHAQSWGYWPAQEVPLTAPWTTVHGEVRHPDNDLAGSEHETDVHRVSFELEEDAAKRLTRAANARIQAPGDYNLLDHNCVDFAREMAQVAGVEAPPSVFKGVAEPKTIYAAGAAAAEQAEASAGPTVDAAEPQP